MTSDIDIHQLWIVYPNGEKMLFLQDECKPYIDARYRILSNIIIDAIKLEFTCISINMDIWYDLKSTRLL